MLEARLWQRESMRGNYPSPLQGDGGVLTPGRSSVPSNAYARWLEYVGDPQDLLARFRRAIQDGDPTPGALGRAVVVFLAASWETYVEELARESAAKRVAARLLTAGDGHSVSQHADSMHNPTVEKAGRLLEEALGDNPWVGVAGGGMTEMATRQMINRNQTMRHQFAHGAERLSLPESVLVQRVQQFEAIVASVDDRARSILCAQMGRDPW